MGSYVDARGFVWPPGDVQLHMDMSLTTCCHCGPDLLEYAAATVLLFFAPIGAFVFRKHIAAATGPWKWAGRALQALAAVSWPFAVLLVVTVAIGVIS